MGAILREGFEAGDPISSGWFTSSGNPMFNVVNTYSGPIVGRTDFNGNGGVYFAAESGFAQGAKLFKRDAEEFFIRFAWVTPNLSFNNSSVSFYDTGAGIKHVNMEINGSSQWRIRRGTTSLGISTAGGMTVDQEWYAWSVHIRIHDSAGFYRVYKNHDYSTPHFDFTGDTRNGASSIVDSIDLYFDNQGETACDDISINDITMTYSGGVGTIPIIGDTITGQASGSTAIITSVLAGSTAAAGTFQLRTVQNSLASDWNGLIANDPFQVEAVNDSASSNLWSASITGLDKNSGFPNDGYIIGLVPNASVVGSIQLDGSDGNQVDNHLLVDETPPSDADYVGTTVTGNRDMYELANLPFAAGDISEVMAVEINPRWIKTDATLNNGKVVLEHSAIEYDSSAVPLSTTASGHAELYDELPDGTAWTVTSVDSIRVGVKFET